jgi:hypothetical protein
VLAPRLTLNPGPVSAREEADASKPLKAAGAPILFSSTCNGGNIPKVGLGQGPFRSAVG